MILVEKISIAESSLYWIKAKWSSQYILAVLFLNIRSICLIHSVLYYKQFISGFIDGMQLKKNPDKFLPGFFINYFLFNYLFLTLVVVLDFVTLVLPLGPVVTFVFVLVTRKEFTEL